MCCGAHASKQKHLKRPVLVSAGGRQRGIGSKDLGKEDSALLRCKRDRLMHFRFLILLGLAAGLGGSGLRFPCPTAGAAESAWTPGVSGTELPLNDVVFGRGRFVAVGEQETVLVSTDGVNWRPEDPGMDRWLLGVGFGNNTFVAVGTDGLVLTSLDGAAWTPRTSGTTNWLYDVAWGEGAFVGVGYAGAIVTSADGSDPSVPIEA